MSAKNPFSFTVILSVISFELKPDETKTKDQRKRVPPFVYLNIFVKCSRIRQYFHVYKRITRTFLLKANSSSEYKWTQNWERKQNSLLDC